MKKITLVLCAIYGLALVTAYSFSGNTKPKSSSNADTTLLKHFDEKHFGAVRQLTFGGDNAEAYFSFDNKNIVFHPH